MVSMKNSLAAILDSNKFTGLNYQDWLRNLNIVLASEKLLYTIDKSPPEETPADISPEELITLKQWRDDELKTRYYVMASIVLASEKLLYTIDKSPPEETPADISPEELITLKQWRDDELKTRYYCWRRNAKCLVSSCREICEPSASVNVWKFVSDRLDEENPFVQNSSVLLVQPDEGVSVLVVDRIGDYLPQSTEKSRVLVIPVGARHKCQQGSGFEHPMNDDICIVVFRIDRLPAVFLCSSAASSGADPDHQHLP
ncbi:hypothetical protein F511_37909 [Dorcoceras hygrometricum]|uniref:Uncharacterized protein n=1 Tax=Dorcoceras hygrometricum TaxID=472368 RepID=A0A2Z7CI05_9LAMI|nr:hypothetical protein F511_37909 [Dorcoceras hygrometricum]